MAKKSRKKREKPVYDGITFDSRLEIYCYQKLKENNIEFTYNETTFELLEGFTSLVDSFEPDKRKGDSIYFRNSIYKGIKYTPDFIVKGGTNIIETKGLCRDKDEMVIKLFKRKMTLDGISCKFFLPKNHKQVDKAIELIKNGTDNNMGESKPKRRGNISKTRKTSSI